jgi:hypothetical protein
VAPYRNSPIRLHGAVRNYSGDFPGKPCLHYEIKVYLHGFTIVLHYSGQKGLTGRHAGTSRGAVPGQCSMVLQAPQWRRSSRGSLKEAVVRPVATLPTCTPLPPESLSTMGPCL